MTDPAPVSNRPSGRMNGGRALAEMLRLAGVGPMFGMGGFQLLPFYDALAQLGMRPFLINDERCGAFAADAYARVTNRPGVCDGTLGPGATNLVTGLIESLNAGVPIIALAGDTNNAKTILGAGKAAFAGGVERLVQSDRAFAVTSELWDTDPWLLGTPGGTIDLRTGKIRPAACEDYITKMAAVAPADTAGCPLWLQFLTQACASDAGLIRFLQQWCGYSLTGSIQEHALLFVHGDGGNGKGVWLNTI